MHRSVYVLKYLHTWNIYVGYIDRTIEIEVRDRKRVNVLSILGEGWYKVYSSLMLGEQGTTKFSSIYACIFSFFFFLNLFYFSKFLFAYQRSFSSYIYIIYKYVLSLKSSRIIYLSLLMDIWNYIYFNLKIKM